MKRYGTPVLIIVCLLQMAFAGAASATTVTSPTGSLLTPAIRAENESTHITINNGIKTLECKSSFEMTVETHGSGVTAKGTLSALSFTGCTNDWHVTVVNAGSMEIHALAGYNGTITSSGMTIDATRFGVTCLFRTENTHLGTITGGSPATFHLESNIPFHGGSFLCGSSAQSMTGQYKITSPGSLYVD